MTRSFLLYVDVFSLFFRKLKFEILNAVDDANEFLLKNTEIFTHNLLLECGNYCSDNPDTDVVIYIGVTTSDLTLQWNTNESYSLEVSTIGKPTYYC